ncbi:MerR family transcriptional regulator [Leifsonia poae]|uniref:MerR family transcriptional regulator n=1 Tax=Leifsonia poae TaxID=110933 RepID=A0A9W6M0E2_9MICO|nr:MerR family transcriptional regulator [Leifsonia poae]GLJ76786.1 MerR family transcriptional regulator [Leifsonia poae]
MRISQLSSTTGVPVATIKFYLREGMLMPGEATSATQALYGEAHVRRIALIRALSDVAGLPLQKVKVVLALIEHPDASLFDTLGEAVAALPPYLDTAPPYPRAQAALAEVGQVFDPQYAAVAQLERALEAVETAGIPMTSDRLSVYAEHLRAIAAYDLAQMPADAEAAVEYAVLGTALYEPIVAALRRLAHQDIAARMLTPEE